MLKKFTKKEWKALKLIALSTPTSGQIRWHDGGTWEWKSSGKYVVAQKAEIERKTNA